MSVFGLTEEEERIQLQRYNHALFKSMMFFADVVWEINIETCTVGILEDKAEPERNITKFEYKEFFRRFLEERVREDQRDLAVKYLSFDSLKNISQQLDFDIEVRCAKTGELNLYRVVLTPAYEDGKLICVYLSARNMQAEVNRQLLEYQGQKQYKDALMSNSYFCFTFDVSGDGMIHEDFVTGDGYHLVQETTEMELPISFEHFARKWLEEYEPQFAEKQEEDVFTIDFLKRAFEKNERVIDMEVKQKVPKGHGGVDYMQILIILTENITDGHIIATVVWRDINAFRKSAIDDTLELKSSNKELRRTLSQEEQFRLASLSGSRRFPARSSSITST